MKCLRSILPTVLSASFVLSACGGGATVPAAAPASSAPSSITASAAAGAKPTSAAVSASAKPATSLGASAKPAASAAPSGVTQLKVGYPQATITQAPLFVAVDEGFFKNNGLDVSLLQIGGPQEIAALLSGDTEFATVGGTELANADQKGSNLVMVATILDLPFFWLYADKKYKTVQDLAGQTVGITAAGSSTDSAARLFLSHFGILDKAKIAPAGGTQPSILAAMTQGGIAGGILSPPVTDQAAKQGYVSLTDGVTLGVPMNTAGLVLPRSYLSQNMDLVKSYLKSYQQGWSFIGNPANQAEVIKVLVKWTKSDQATVEPGYQAALKVWQATKTPTVNPEAITNLLNLNDDPAIRAVKAEAIIDNSILQSVQ